MTEWTIAKLVEWTTQHFASKGIESARLDGELLLSHTLKCKRIDLYLKFDKLVTGDELKVYKELVLRRAKREPVAYILGQQEFYNRSFDVSSGVLIPRPETEHLIEAAMEWFETKSEDKLMVLDVGCGSGAIAVTLAAENPNVMICALDTSKVACEKTKTNANKNNVTECIQILNTPFLDWQSKDHFDLVISNPPYVGKNMAQTLRPDVINFEPPEALFGGEFGSEILEQWIPKMVSLLKPKSLLLCEIGFDQESVVKEYCAKTGLLESIEVLKDYSGHPRILRAFKKAEA